ILLPQIDPDNPATLSPAIITGLLRQEMGFDGVVISDDLTMGAISNNYELGVAAVKAINAGSDIVLVCHDYEKERAVIEAIREAAASGAITEERIDQSVYRVLKLKQKYALNDQKIGTVDPEAINAKINALFKEYF
ncbi:MAG: beta-N-acetylhexosaminidase, partial [Clostridia bacterium]|nr:beta-N-acetylhexosaminidase [Clostridia bacterium]